MVYYLKYRPKTLAELDNPEIASLIGKYLSKTTIPHAFLFTGPKGIGKTSTARIVAKSINCPKSKTPGVACGVCDECVSIARGEDLDVLEIDAASNRGIDEIRDLREKIKLAPTHLKYKVYIIDEVHMLTTEAFNALLKTLEEPPAHAFFILATTEAHKVPETIRSRCIRVEFHRATAVDIMRSLKRAAKGEKLEVTDLALEEIANASDGSFRDGHKLLEEAALTSKLTLAEIKQSLGVTDTHTLAQFIALLKAKKAKELLLLIRQLVQDGKQIKPFFLSILKLLEEMLVASFENKSEWKREEIIRALTLFSNAFTELKNAVLPTLPFELAIVDYCDGRYEALAAPLPSNAAKSTVISESQIAESAIPLANRWPELLEAVKKQNTSLVGVLRSCKPLSLDNGVLVIEAAYKFHADRVNDPKVRDLLASVVKDLLGLDVKIQATIKKRV